MSCFCFASYDARLTGGLVGSIEAMADTLGVSEECMSPSIVAYPDGRRLKSTDYRNVEQPGFESVEIGMCARQSKTDVTDFGFSYEKREPLESSMLFVCRDGIQATKIGDVFGLFVERFANSGDLGYSIGFESHDVSTGSLHAAGITSGTPLTAEENLLADDDGRFFFDRISRPAASRKFHSGKVRAFHQLNLLDSRQFTRLAEDSQTRYIVDKFCTKSIGSGFYLFLVDQQELAGINSVLRSRGLLI